MAVIRNATTEDIEKAPNFSVFVGAGPGIELQSWEWDLFAIDELYEESEAEAERLGLDLNADMLNPQVFDNVVSSRIVEVDDLDAAVAYLREGGTLAKLPDTLTIPEFRFSGQRTASEYFRLYVVGEPPARWAR